MPGTASISAFGRSWSAATTRGAWSCSPCSFINFVVITRGACRISDVSARFTWMPARPAAGDRSRSQRRPSSLRPRQSSGGRKFARKPDFYGPMDGAQQVRARDAVAGSSLVFINISAAHSSVRPSTSCSWRWGRTMRCSHGWTDWWRRFGVAAVRGRRHHRHPYAAHAMSPPDQERRCWGSPRRRVHSGILTLLGIIPGMPNLVFLGMAAACAVGALFYEQASRRLTRRPSSPLPVAAVLPKQRELSWDDVRARGSDRP